MGKRRAASDHRRADILAAALHEIRERGLANATIADIRRRSGASTGSIYHHFGRREGVLAALYMSCLTDCFAQMETAVARQSHTRQGIEALVHSYLAWVEAEPDKATFVYDASQGQLLHGYLDEIMAHKAQLYAGIYRWMAPRIASGELIELPPWAYDAIMMGPAHEFARRWLAGMRDMPMQTARQLIAAAVWRAVRPDPAADAPTGEPQ